jgi:O-acetyl-ADP-ribose deacetylase (regulator of RNase III)
MSALELRRGNLLQADAEALVNTVNTVGIMGKGIALQFRKAYPYNYQAYRKACERGEVVPGKMFVFETGQLTGPRLIVNFPTKRHWKSKTRVEDVEAGLVDLVEIITSARIRSIAVPPLGCGNGGLEWAVVKPMIERALKPLPDLRVLLFEPAGPPPPDRQPVATKPPRMTRGRAALLAVLNAYRTDPGSNLTRLVAQKMAYFLQTAGEPLHLSFEKGQYGPYAEAINHVLQRMEGHFVTGYGDRSSPSDLHLDPTAVRKAHSYLSDDPSAREHIERVSHLIDGFESPLGLELLATVHWVAQHGESSTPDEALKAISDWNPRKREVFRSRHVAAAWERLEDEGWISTPPESAPLSA